MTTRTRHRLSQAGLYVAAGVNLGAVVAALVAQRDATAGAQLALVALLVVVAEGCDRFHVWLDLRIEKARTEGDLAKVASEHFQRQLSAPSAEMRVHPDVPRWRN